MPNYLTDRQIAARFAVNRATVWRWLKVDQDFPRPISLSAGCTRWKLTDIEEWEHRKANAAA